MAFDIQKFASKGDGASDTTPNLFTYDSVDDVTVVDYFNEVYRSLKVGDIIMQWNGTTILTFVVTAIDNTTGAVTVAAVL